MNPKVWQLMGRAHEDIEAAEDVLRTTHPDRAAGDAYYAMFHAAEALLLSLGMEFSKHGATDAAFGKHFSKPGRVPRQLHRYMLDAFDARLTTEYDVTVKLQVDQVREILGQAKEFVAAAEQYLNALEK